MKNFYAFLVLLLIGNFGFGQINENFDTGLSGSYTTGNQTLTSGTWETVQVIAEAAGDSRGATGSAARINDEEVGASLTTPTLSAGADVVSFWYRELNSGGGTFALQTSTDGTNYTTQTTQLFSGNTYTQFTYTVNNPSPNLTIRILNDNQLGHLIIDDFDVTAFPVNSIVIGTGTTTTGSIDADPIHGYYNAFKYQVVYTAAELAATLTINDEITALGWSIAGDYAGGNLLGYTIKLGHTSAANSAAHDASSTTVVKNAFNYDPTVTTAGVFDMIPFDTNFVWNGVDNVLVEVCSDGQNPFTGPYGQVRTNIVTSGSRFYRVDGGTACGVNTNTANGNKPNIQFNYIDGIPPACFDVTALTVDSFTDTQVVVSWTAGAAETDWEIVVQADGTGEPTGAGTATTTNPHTTTGLLERTDYEVYVRANCGLDGFSNWVGPVTFTTEPSCPDVTAITIDNFTDLTATVSWTAGAAETDWEIVVQPDGTGEPTGAGTATTTNPHTQSGLTEQTAYEVYVRSDCDTNGFGLWVGPIDFTTAPSCPDVTVLTLDTATDTTATISWTAGGTETAWEIVVQADGTGIPTGAGTATTNPHTETGLTVSTDYEVYVRADCTASSNGYSGWVGPLDFTTTAAPITTYPYNENFEGGAAGWTIDNTTNGSWQLGNPANTIINAADSGAIAWVTNLTGDYNSNEDSFVMSPPFNFSTLAAPVIDLSIWWSSEFSWDGAVLQSSIDNGNTWQNVGALNDPNNWYNDGSIGAGPGGQQIGWTGTGVNASGAWVVATNNLLGLGGQSSVFLRVAFAADGGTNGEGFAFDTVNIYDPSCPDVSALTIDSLTGTTADISWTAGNTEIDWEIVVQADGTGEPTGAGTATSTNPYAATGLTAETAYEVYVRANCLGNGFSAWVGPLDFTTPCATFTAPYSEDFENAGAVPDCWTLAGNVTWLFNTSGPNHVGNGGTLSGTTASSLYYAVVDDSNTSGTTTAELISPLVDLTPLTTPALSFYEISDNEGFANSTLTVEVWDGAAWNVVGTYNANTTGWEQKLIDLSGLTFTGPAQARFSIADSGSFYDDIAIDDVSFDEFPSCFDVTALAIDSSTDTSATISWTAGGTETDWEIVVQAAGTGVPTGAGTATTTNPHTASGLTAETAYEVYVRANCLTNGFSAWTGPITFTTLCSAIAPEYIADMSVNVPDSCWEQATNGEVAAGPTGLGSSSWTSAGTGDDNNYGASIFSNRINIYGTTAIRDWLISPTFDLSSGGPFQLEMNVAVTNFNDGDTDDTMGADDEVQLLVSTDGGATWVNLTTWNTGNEPDFTGTEYVEDLTAYSGNTQFAIWASNGTATGQDYDFHVGKFKVRAIPSCDDITSLAIDSFTDTTAAVSWTAGAAETDWEIVVQPDGTGVPTGAGTATTTNPHTLSGLTPLTAYEVYVRANCLGNGFSAWIGPVDFSTTATPITVYPYTENFDAGAGDWTVDNTTNGTWALGAPTNTIINSADSGTDAWVTNLTGSYNDSEDSYVISPPFDLTALANPVFEFSIWWNAEFSWDGMVLQSSIDSGGTWQNVGALNDPNNWYNDGTIGGTPGGQQVGWTGRNSSSNGSNGWVIAKHDLTGLGGQSNVVLRVAFGSDSSGNDEGVAFDSVSLFEPSCLDVTAVTIDSFTDTEAVISWTAGDTETDWEIAVQADGTGEPTGAGTATTTNPYTATGLTADTAYEIYVRANCLGNGFSAWVGPLDFTTLCTTFTAPYSEDFENAGAVPDCWTLAGNVTWLFNTSGPNHVGDGGTLSGATASGLYYAVVDDSNTSGTTTAELISPLVDLTPLTTPALSFYEISDNEGFANSTLTVEVWDGAAWNVVGTYNTNTTGWEEKLIDLSGLTFTGPAQARFSIADSGSFYDDIAIDDVSFNELPSCLDPSALTLDSSTDTSATISWTIGSTETDWEIVVQADGTGAPTGAGTATTTNPHTTSGLTAETAYEVYVRANCLTNGFSAWVGPLDFTTPCSNILPAYFADMSVNVPDSCWAEATNGEVATGPTGIGSSSWTSAGTGDDNNYGASIFSNRINIYGTTAIRDWLISPTFDLSSGGPFQLEMNVAVTNFNDGDTDDTMGADDEVQLLVSTDGGATWVNLTTWNTGNEPDFTGTEYVEDLTAYSGNTQFAIWASNGTASSTDYDFHVGSFIVRTPPTCLDVTAITIDSFTETEVTVSWTNGDTETAWEVAVQPEGTGVPTGSGTATTTNPHTESGLSGATAYEVYVRADCAVSGFSAWVGPVDFSTLCGNLIPEYIADMSTNVPDLCWDEATNGEVAAGPTGLGSSSWSSAGTGDDNNYGAGIFSNRINIFGSFTPIRDWLISPTFDLSSGGPFQLDLNVAVTNFNDGDTDDSMGADDEVQLLVSTDGGTTWSNLTTWNAGNEPDFTGTEYIEDLTAYSGNTQFAIWASNGTASGQDYDFHVGKFRVRAIPSCPEPAGLTVDSFTRDSATISWTAGATETDWEIVVQPDGTGIPTGAGTATTTNPHTETGLTAATAYEVYVRANCGLGDLSEWTGPLDFTTSNPLPTVDTTLNVSACGTAGADSYNGAYDASTQNIVWAQLNYTAGCPSLTIDTIGSDFDTEIGIYDANGVFIGSNDSGGTGITPQSLFNELGLANGTYYIAAGMFNVTFGADFAVTSSNTAQTGTLFINASGQTTAVADYVNLQFPASGTITEGANWDVYAQVYEPGITDAAGQGANIEAWIGYSTTDATTAADFTSGWTWIAATFNTDVGNNDEYQAEIGSTLSPGQYYYVSRFSVDSGAYSYGGINPGSSGGNFWNGTTAVSGQLTVNSNSIPTTVATLNINGCGDSDSYNGAYAAATEAIVWVELIYDGNCTEITVDTESTSFSDTEIGLYDTFGTRIGNDDDGGTGNLSLLTELGLPAGTYYIAAGAWNMVFGATNFDVTSTQTSTSGTLFINASTPNMVDYCNLQSPSSGTINVGGNYDVYAQILETGVTEAAGQGANILSWIGYNTTDATTTADFASGWTWVAATYNTDSGNNDEYQAEIGSGLAVGSYFYVSRFTVDGGDFAYGGINPGSTDGNFWDGTSYVSGQLTVNPTPEPTNHVLAFTAVADSDSQITLTWNDNDGAQPADGFVIVGKTGAGVFTTIVDGTAVANDTDWSDDEFEFNRNPGAESYTVVGLDASTLYEFEIYPYTNSASLIDFKTDGTVPSTSATTASDPCLVAVMTFPFNEGFETGLIPMCWSQEFDAGSVNWTYNNGGQGTGTTITSAHTGSFNAIFYDTAATSVVKLVSPKLDLTGLTNPTLSYWHAQEIFGAGQDELRVYYKTSAAGAWTLIPGQEFLGSIAAWTEETLLLPNPSADYYIAFEATGDFGHGVLLDDVMVEEVIAISYTFTAGTWAPSDPNGTATVNDDITIVSGDAVISSNTSADNITVNPGASITVNTGITLTVDGDLTLESVSNSYSSLIQDGTIIGTIKYERFVNANSGGNDLVSAPLAGETWANFLLSDTNAADLLDNGLTSPTTYAWAPFDKTTGTYINYTDATVATLTSGTGYRAATDPGAGTGTTLTFTGTVPTTAITVNITDVGPLHPDWNLVGNPYPSYINMFDFLFYEVVPASGVSNYQLLEDESGIYGYDGNAANGWDVVTLANSFGRLMAPGQGFLVAANDAQVVAYDLTFDTNMRTTGNGDDFIAGRNSDVLTYFKLNANTATKDYTTQFYFNEESSLGADHGYDGKVWGTPPNFALYSHLVQDNENVAMALQSLNTSDMMDVVIPLGVNANSGEQLTFTITESTLPTTAEVYLDDTLNNTSTLLNNGDYVITPSTNLNGTGRFYLRVTNSALSTTDNDFNSIKIYTTKSPRSIFISGIINDDTTAKIFDIQGRLVYSIELESNDLLNEIDASDLQDGVYVVTLSDGTKQKSQKVIIR